MKNGRYEESGNVLWYKDDVLHRLDGPAYEWSDGEKAWWLNGKLHRLDGPAYVGANGSKEWYWHGKCHRVDGPAVEWAGGSKEWFIQGTKVDITLIDYDGSRPLTDEEITYLLLCS